MQSLYPFLLNPEYVERIWGTRDLAPFYEVPAEGTPIGEVWLTGDRCQVRNGELAGKTLAELAREFGEQLTGSGAWNPSRFPLLVKVLFPNDRLSVQVHPDDLLATAERESCGKTECWYVLCAEPGAQVALGVKPGTGMQQIKQAIRESTLESLLNWMTVRPGEMIYVAAGTIHAIGPGSILLEIQQNSDTTYRLYDYGRPRELHIDKGLAATKVDSCAGRIAPIERNGHRNLIEAPCFTVNRFLIDGSSDLTLTTAPIEGSSSPHCIFALEGAGRVEAPGKAPVTFHRGHTVLVPAILGEYSVRSGSNGRFEFICAHVPARETGHPHSRVAPREQSVGVQ